ncbi:MAG: hypothetical protein QOE82_3317 [Thermoanaerobaculia bacterium]|jgi:hypothetical protein|nr:hypothetical protein [Thermoanaerobaculia bacterium]
MPAIDAQLAAQLTSTAIALVALFIGLRNENRNQIRFRKQLALSKRIADANIRPLLALTISGYTDRKAMELVNHGMGTAVIRNISLSRGDLIASKVPDLLDLGREVVWNDFTELDDVIEYLPSKGVDVLVLLTFDRLTKQGLTETEATAVMEMLESQLDEVKVTVTYDDVLGNVIAEDEQLN